MKIHMRSWSGGLRWLAGVLLVAALPTVVRAEGIDTPIKRIYIVAHPHLDIGYTEPPQVVEEECKRQIDNEMAFAKEHPDYKWTIEETWQLRQWMKRSSPEEIETLMKLIRDGRFGLGGGHSTLHSSKAGIEELNRYLYDSERLRREYNIPIETVMHDDSPGLPWSYPQVLSKSGIKYLVAGMNLFIGGGFDAPYHPYLMEWEGPDGSRVITWVTWTGYFEGVGYYGFRWRRGELDVTRLETALKEVVAGGYPYEALMIQCSADNYHSARLAQSVYQAAREWNATHDNPKFLMARPEDFFADVLANNPKLPVMKGDWISPWDTIQMIEPQSEMIAKNAQDVLLTAEKTWALATALGAEGYPHDLFRQAWDDVLVIDEHSGAGDLAKRGGAAQEEIDELADYFDQKVLALRKAQGDTGQSGAEALFSHLKFDSSAVLVFNPLSWTRTDTVAIPMHAGLAEGTADLWDPQTSKSVPTQVVETAAGQSVIFVADSVPALGVKRYAIRPAAGSDEKTKKDPEDRPSSAPSRLENDRFRIDVAKDGSIRSLYDKKAKKELVFPGVDAFGSLIQRTNSEYFMSAPGKRVDVQGPVTISTGRSGPVSHSLVIRRDNSPLPETEIVLYDDLDRVDFLETVDRDSMERATMADNALVFSFVFPMNLSDAAVRLDTPAGWFQPSQDSAPGVIALRWNPEHSVNLEGEDYNLSLISPDVYTVEVRPAVSEDRRTTATLVASTFYRKVDEAQIKGGVIGNAVVEAAFPPRWTMRYSLVSKTAAFDPLAAERIAWEGCTPLVGGLSPEGEGALSLEKPIRFLAVDAPNVLLFDMKAAEFGDDIILKMQEAGGESATAVVSSDVFTVANARETNLVERDLEKVFDVRDNEFRVAFRPHEIKCVRLTLSPRQ